MGDLSYGGRDDPSLYENPQVIYPSGLKEQFSTEKEAFAVCARWNQSNKPVQRENFYVGAYVVAGGVMATDPLHPYKG